jgi:hypothetical protein
MKHSRKGLRRRYGHATVPKGYVAHTAPANSLQENVYKGKHLVGTCTLKGPGQWEWWLARIPEGRHSHPTGIVSTLGEAFRAVVKANRGYGR